MRMVNYNYVRTIRKEQGLSQDQLAMLSGLSKATISYVENFIKIPTQDTMVRISVALNKDTHIVFNLTSEIL